MSHRCFLSVGSGSYPIPLLNGTKHLTLRRTYTHVSKRTLIQSQRYAHARQMKRAAKQVKKLRTMLGSLIRDIDRKTAGKPSPYLLKQLDKARRLHQQQKSDKNKLYSLHEPTTQCIAKGKVGRKYEFGHKVSLAVSATTNWVVAALGLPGNPFDGHPLKETLQKAEQNTNVPIKEVYVDRGYKGHGCDQNIVTIDRERKGSLTRRIWKKLKHRSAIEPVIGHLKSDCRLECNYLSGEEGNVINAILERVVTI